MHIEIRQIPAEDTLPLRQRVMWPDHPLEALRLEGDDCALHFGAFFEARLVGVGSFFADGATCRLRKLAVDMDMQGKGVATDLLSYASDHLHAAGFTAIWCDARVSAIGFYERLGFACEADIFQKQGLDYVVARRAL